MYGSKKMSKPMKKKPMKKKAVKKKKGKKKACWKGYTAYGMKNKGGRKVPNCVPNKRKKGK